MYFQSVVVPSHSLYSLDLKVEGRDQLPLLSWSSLTIVKRYLLEGDVWLYMYKGKESKIDDDNYPMKRT